MASSRYDLPGGSLERNESISQALHREFLEETGCGIEILRNIGVRDYVVPWTRSGHEHTHCHHIALFYEVACVKGQVEDSPKVDDSLGAEWIEIDMMNENNASPLIMEAVNWIQSGELGKGTRQYERWEVKVDIPE